MGGIEDRLGEIDQGKPPVNPVLKSELERALEEEEAELAREMRIGRAEETIAKREVRIKELRELLKKGGGTMSDEERATKEEKLREEISTTAITLLGKGVDPKIVGQYILGSTPVTPITVAGGAAAPQGLTIKDVKEIMDMATGNKGEGELKGVLEKLTARVEAIGSRQPPDPIALAQQQAQAIGATYEALKTLGIIKEPVATTHEGEPLEVVKERNRHEERLEEVRADRAYKQEITEIASGTFERIGRGAAHEILSGREEEGSSGGGELEYLICECGQKIPIMPETGPQVTCPKCGTIYTRKQTTEGKTE